MAFPAVAARNQTASSANSTGAYTIPLPASIAAGDLLIAWLARDGTGVETWGSGIAGWNVLVAAPGGSTPAVRGAFLYKIATGTESGNLSIAGPAENWAGHSARLTGYDPNLPPAFATASGTSTNPNPGSLNPADWGTEDTLWLALAAGDCVDTNNITAAPSSYTNTNFQRSTDGTAGNRVVAGYSERQLNAASDDPGTFTRGVSDEWLCATIGIRPTPAAPEQPILRSGGFYSASGTSPTNSFTLDAGSNRRVFVSVAMESGTVSSMTYGGVSMSLVTDGTDTATSTNTARVEWWELRESSLPSNGSNSLVVNLSGSIECYINFVVVSNTSQNTNVTDVNNANTGAATTVTTNVTVGVTGSLILSCSNKNNTPHFTNFTVGGVRAMGRGSCALPTGGAFIMNVAMEVTATGSTAVTSTCESIRQVMSTVLLEPFTEINISGAVTSSSPTATGTITGGTAPSFEDIEFVDWDHDLKQDFEDNASITATLPVCADGDFIIVFITTTQDCSPNTPSGWTVLGTTLAGATSSTPECTAYGRIKQSGDGGTQAFTNATAATDGYGQTAQAIAFSGVDPVTPLDATTATANGAGAPPNPPSITPVTAGAMLVVFGFMDNVSGTLVQPSGFTNPGGSGLAEANAGGGADNGSRSSMSYKLAAGGAEDPPALTTDTNDEWGALTLALRPASTGSTDTDISGAISSSSPSASGSIEVVVNITGSVSSSSPSAAGAVQAAVNISGAISSSSPSAAGAVQAAVNITGAIASSSPSASGTVQPEANITGAISSSAPSASGSLQLEVNVSGAVTSSSPSASGALDLPVNIQGAISSSSPSASGTLQLEVNITGAVASSSPSASGSVTVTNEANISGAIASSSPSASGSVQVEVNITGAVTSSSPTAAGAVQAAVNVTGAVASSSPSASGSVQPQVNVTGAVASSSPSANGQLTVEVNVSGAVSSSSPSATGAVELPVNITGAVSSSSPSASGTIVADNSTNITGAVSSSPPTALGSVQVVVNITGAVVSSSPSAFGQIFGTIFVSGAISSSSPSASGTVVLGDVPTGETAVVIGEDNTDAQLQAQEGGVVVLAEQIGVTVTIVLGTSNVRIGNA